MINASRVKKNVQKRQKKSKDEDQLSVLIDSNSGVIFTRFHSLLSPAAGPL